MEFIIRIQVMVNLMIVFFVQRNLFSYEQRSYFECSFYLLHVLQFLDVINLVYAVYEIDVVL